MVTSEKAEYMDQILKVGRGGRESLWRSFSDCFNFLSEVGGKESDEILGIRGNE